MKSWLNVLVLCFIQALVFSFFLVYRVRNVTRAIQAQIQVCHTALTPTYLNLDICNLIVPAQEFNYRPFCHSGERRDHTGQICCCTWHVRAKTSSCDSNWLSILSIQPGRPLSNWSEKNSMLRQISPFLIRERRIHKSWCDCQSESFQRHFWEVHSQILQQD